MEKIKSFLKNPKVIIGVIAVLIISLPFLVTLVLKQQDIRQRAASLTPITFEFSPKVNTVTPGSTFNVDFLLNAGTYDIGSVHFIMTYDPALLQVTVLSNGTALSPAIQTNTNGTYETTMLNPTATPVTGNGLKIVTFQLKALTIGSATLSVNPGIQATATGQSTYIPVDNPNDIIGTYLISNGPTTTPGVTITIPPTTTPILTPILTEPPTASPVPTASPTPIPTSTPIPTPTPTSGPSTGGSVILFATLPGIGTDVTKGENNSPIHPSRSFDVYAVNSQNQVASTTKLIMNYVNGAYTGTASFNNLPNGSYTVKMRSDNSLIKTIPGIYNLSIGDTTNTPSITLVTGDIQSGGSSTNILDIDDYNALLACYSGSNCPDSLKALSDLNDDGVVDEKDLNVLLRGFATRIGD